MLLWQFPIVAAMDCAACTKNQTDEHWRFIEHPKGSGKILQRSSRSGPPCRYPHIGCPKGTPENSRALNSRNAAAYRFHKECEAVNQWPDDAIVRRNAALIRDAERACERIKQDRQVHLLESFLGVVNHVR